MSNLQNIAKRLSRGTSGWLLYEFSCNRGYLFNEKYLSYPIGNILNNLTKYQLLTEVNHPFRNLGGRGRPLQVDFVLQDKYNKVDGEWKFAKAWLHRELSAPD